MQISESVKVGHWQLITHNILDMERPQLMVIPRSQNLSIPDYCRAPAPERESITAVQSLPKSYFSDEFKTKIIFFCMVDEDSSTFSTRDMDKMVQNRIEKVIFAVSSLNAVDKTPMTGG